MQNGRPAPAGRPPSHALTRSCEEHSRGGRPQGGYMPVLSPRRIAALALELGEDFEPGVTPPSAALLESVALMQGAHRVECEPSAHERKRRRERERRAAYAAVPDWFSVDDLVPTAFESARRLM